MALILLAVFYLCVAGSEVAAPAKCLAVFEAVIQKISRIRVMSAALFFITFLYYIATPRRLEWVFVILFWLYLLSALWLAIHPYSFRGLCRRSLSLMSDTDKRSALYLDCAMRTLLALMIIYAI